MPHISVVAPIYKETSATLDELAARIGRAVSSITQDYEIVLVDDGSPPDTWASLLRLTRADPHVRAVRLARNFGQHPAISAGLDHAEGDWVVVMDGDLQDRPEIIPELYAKAQEGFDVIFVNRLRRPEGRFHVMLSHAFYAVLNMLAGDAHNRQQANYSIISRAVVEAFRTVPDRDRFYGGTIRWLGFSRTTIDAFHGERVAGASHYNLRSRMRLAHRIIVGYSTRLLYSALLFGAGMTAVSFAMMFYVILEKLRDPSAPVLGWPSLMTAIFFASGVTNLMLGLIGLYMAELFDWSKGRPRYVVAQTSRGDSKP